MYRLCMAKILNVYIQDDNQEKLKDIPNQSKLINDLLREHFRKLDPNQMTPEEIRKEIKRRKLKEEFEKRLKEI